MNIRDISSRKRFEKRLRDSRDEAQRANLAKSEFLSRMSHELRTPLNAILGFSQLLVRAEVEPGKAEKVNFIHRAGKHLLDLINEVLDLARIEAGKLCCSIEEVSVSAVIREIGDYSGALAAEHEIALDLSGAESCDAIVSADQQRLKQILLNLVANAIKYNRVNGTVTVTCENKGNGQVEIAVADSGPGLSKEQLADLFTPFERLGADHSKSIGTGIGLALSQSLAELMGTSIEVESEIGVGSRFSIRLALVGEERKGIAVGADDCPLVEPGIVVSSHRNGTGPKMPLLYIEDNPLNLRLVKEILKESVHWELVPAETGNEGIEKARALIPRLIFLDVHLPDLNGDKVLKELRNDAELDESVIVVMTADAMGDGESVFRELGADHFLTKPINIPAILELLEEVATRKQGLPA